MASHSYQDLRVWQAAMRLTESVYKIIEKLPAEERFALADQLRRSAVSVPSNIAEGQRRFGDAETAHFCSIALGSLAELETQLLLANKIYSVPVDSLIEAATNIAKMLSGLTRSIRENKKSNTKPKPNYADRLPSRAWSREPDA